MRGYVTDPSAPGGLRLDGDLPEPEPAGHELLVEVHAYSINPGEAHLISSRSDGWQPGQDVAGTVVAAAADGSGPAPGARAVAVVEGAGWSERVAVHSQHLATLSEAVTFEQAAALPIAGLTALRALRQGGDLLGRRVLVTGATGGVGHLAVQLGAAAGARVTALVRSPEREQEALALGAAEVVTALGDGDGPFSLALDGVGGPGLAEVVARLAPEGTAVLYGAAGGPSELGLGDFLPGAANARVLGLSHARPEETKGEDLAILAGLVGDGRLQPALGYEGGWEDTAAAFEALAARAVRGKAVLRVR